MYTIEFADLIPRPRYGVKVSLYGGLGTDTALNGEVRFNIP